MYFKVLEYCANGSLLKYLRNHKSKFHQGLFQQVLYFDVLLSIIKTTYTTIGDFVFLIFWS
jgi:hypothetical protein